MQWQSLDISVLGLKQHYLNGDFTPMELLDFLQREMDEYLAAQDNPVWIYRLSVDELAPYLSALEKLDPKTADLWGVPFAIKDNIDLAGVPTTAACPAFSYTPSQSAFVVQRLLDAGAIPLGKTNLDQFATGLVGVRSPYGVCRNALNASIISGGSSSGSAVAVAKHWVSFSLGTDTAGSGRVPAALNNIVGLKPTKGLLSTTGVVPACKSLDCVSIFALNTDDANTVMNVAAAFDQNDSYARGNTFNNGKRFYRANEKTLTIGIPKPEQLEFFGDFEAQLLFSSALQAIKQSGATVIEVDFAPFMQAAALLYQGPWVAERYLATKNLIESQPEELLPVIRTIIGGGGRAGAIDAFAAQYQLQACAQKAAFALAKVDAIVTPTNGTAYSIDEVLGNPIELNSNLGYYTNFMNLLDCAAVAIPHGFKSNGVGCGLTVFSNAFSDKKLLSIAAQWQNIFGLPAGCHAPFKIQGNNTGEVSESFVDVAVCGAHLQGQPLNWQLLERGAKLIACTQTSSQYQLYALPGGPPMRPALIRTDASGTSIEVEVWRLPLANFGSFVAAIPAPLGIGKVELKSGNWCSGFICEGGAITNATNISSWGGWRAYLASMR